jgi:myo-inositol-1(or 4)-monophosphatase
MPAAPGWVALAAGGWHAARVMTSENFRPQTAAAIEAVTAGLGVARKGEGAADIQLKGPRDLVTAADVAAEDAIRAVLGRLPGTTVVGEERGGEAPRDGAPYWLVDPICGTRNFASGLPLYSVNLALVEGGEVTVAAVGDPFTGEVHVAERGRGASALGGGSLAYLAAGRIAAYIVVSGEALHTAAGTLLAAEAGAIVTDIEGRPWTADADSAVAAATPALLQDLLVLTRAVP